MTRPSSPREPPPAPDYAEALRGWRVWLVTETEAGFRLRSVVFPIVWHARRRLEADCLCPRRRSLGAPWRNHDDHEPVPTRGECGIYATDRIERAAVYADYAPVPGTLPGVLVAGLVGLWGRVVVAERGWRAQFAYPLHLTTVWSPRAACARPEVVLDDLSRYRVPLEALPRTSPARLVEHLRAVERDWARRAA